MDELMIKKKIEEKIDEIFIESKKNYIDNLTNEQKYNIYTEDISAFQLLIFLFFLFTPAILVHYTIPDVKEFIIQISYNLLGYIAYFFTFGISIDILEKYFKKKRMKNFSDFEKKSNLDKLIYEAFLELPASNIVLSKFKEKYGSEKLIKVLEEKNGNIKNREIKKIIKEQEEINKYKDIVESL